MADAPTLGDYFAKKNKKKIKGLNLNVVSAANKPETKKPKSKDTEEDGWQEEQVVAATMKVEVAGKLTREEDKKEEEDAAAPAWGSIKSKSDASSLSEKKYPTLAKSVRVTTNINIDDGTDTKVNIATSKNVFAALENDEDEDDQDSKRPKEIKPAMVQKRKGEREKVAIQREVDRYSTKKPASKREDDDEDSDDDDDKEEKDEAPEEAAPAGDAVPAEEATAKKRKPKVEAVEKADPRDEKEEMADLKIVPDLEATKAKYEGRKKPFPPKPLPRSELEEEKENKPVQQGKKKKVCIQEDFEEKQLQFCPWD